MAFIMSVLSLLYVICSEQHIKGENFMFIKQKKLLQNQGGAFMEKKKLKTFLALLLAITVFLQPLPCQVYAYNDYSNKYKCSTFYHLDEILYTKEGSYGDIGDWTKSGNYYYEVLDPTSPGKKYVTIRRVEDTALENGVLTIPSEIDGYQVLGVGAFNFKPSGGSLIGEGCCILEKPELLQKVIFSEGIEVIGMCSFFGCANLKQIHFPQSLVYIAALAFYKCGKISELAFPQGIVVGDNAFDNLQVKKTTVYSNCIFPDHAEDAFVLNYNKKLKSVLYINYYEKDYYKYTMFGYQEKIYVSPDIIKFSLDVDVDESDNVYARVKQLIINGRHTKLVLHEEINYLVVYGIYTMKGANAIKEAKKYGIPYFVKKTGKTQTVKAKKKSEQYKASWKKVTTKIERHMDYNNWKGKILKKKVTTKYKVYGRSKKSDSYKKICTTTKTNIKSKYKYIKAVPVKEWD